MLELCFQIPAILLVIALLGGWVLDLLCGDPATLPHPIVLFGRMIAAGERTMNKGRHRRMKGALLSMGLIVLVFGISFAVLRLLPLWLYTAVSVVMVFYCLAGTTLIREVKDVFLAADRSLDEGRRQVARIVGRDTSQLSAQEVRTAALETLAENLSDGVIAPLFWFLVAGVPGMLTYKMVNTLDSMIGYHTERYLQFGCFAARTDDAANYLPARITALLMVMVNGHPRLVSFVWKYGRQHASPNSGYPEAALAGILNCRFGGPHYYFGELFPKPYIGENARQLTTQDMLKAVTVNRRTEIMAIILIVLTFIL